PSRRGVVRAGLTTVLAALALVAAAPQAGDAEKLAGAWKVVKQEPNTQRGAIDAVVFRGDKMTLYMNATGGTTTVELALHLDETTSPKGIDLTAIAGPGKGSTYHGIYRLEKNRLTICYTGPGGARPSAFSADDGKAVLLEMTRGAR